jgi:hypothetical protein
MKTSGLYSLRLKALAVETAQILGTRIYRIERGGALTALLTPPPPAKTGYRTGEGATGAKSAIQTVINGDLKSLYLISYNALSTGDFLLSCRTSSLSG